MTKNKQYNFVDIMKQHTEDMKNARYAAIECLIANTILRTGCSIWDVELVETHLDQGVSWSVQKKDSRQVEYPSLYIISPTYSQGRFIQHINPDARDAKIIVLGKVGDVSKMRGLRNYKYVLAARWEGYHELLTEFCSLAAMSGAEDVTSMYTV